MTTNQTYGPTPSSPSSPQPPTQPGALDRFFSALRSTQLVRTSDGHLGGVCAGLAHRLGISPGIVRLVAVLTAVFGVGVTLYLVAWLLLPDSRGQVHLERAIRQGQASSIVLLVFAVFAILPDGGRHHDDGWSVLATMGLIAVAVLFGLRASSRCQSGATPTPPAASSYPGYPTYPTYPTNPTYPGQPGSGPQDAPRH